MPVVDEEMTGSNLDTIEVISNEEEQMHYFSTIVQDQSNENYIEIHDLAATFGNRSNEEINSGVHVISNEKEVETHDMATTFGNMSNEECIEINNEENSTKTDNICGSLLGMKRDTMEQMYELYYNHARALGFSVRKSTCRYSRDAVPIELAKLFVCSCNGEKLKRSDSSSTDTSTRKKNTIVTRTNCLAMMRAKRTDDGIYVVVKHETNHNHTMTREEWSHFHRSEREIIDEKARAIEDMTSSGMRATESFRYLAHNVGGEENVGHTMKDHINFVNRLKSNIIEAGDAETVLDMLQDQEVEENDFFYKIKMDDEGRLANIFWRDSMMKEDYEIYGDVMVFDTTYITNR
ncbi:hypothetical protein ACS0TY_013518 [Phlomoides rotata]